MAMPDRLFPGGRGRLHPTLGNVCRQDPQRCQSCRSAHWGRDELRSGDQSDDRPRAGHHHPRRGAAASHPNLPV